MKRTVCLVLIFLLAQLLSSLAVLFFFNLPALLQDGHLEMGVLAESPTAISVSLILNAVVMWAVMTLLRWTDRRSFRWQGYGWKLYVIVLLGMVPVIFLVNLLLESLALEDWNAVVFGRMVRHPLGVLALVLVGPFMEELVFRMGIQRHLMRHRMHPWVAIAVSSVIFGVVHGNPAQVPGAILFGVVLGWLYWRSGTIWMSIAAHVFNNLVGVVMIWLTGTDSTLLDLCGGAGTAVLCALVALLGVYAVYRYLDGCFPRQMQSPFIGKGTDSGVARS